MTCIAWDGKTLAADRMVGGGGIALTTIKIHRVEVQLTPKGVKVPGLVAIVGEVDTASELLAWLNKGAIPKKFPESAREFGATLVLITGAGIQQWAGGPYPLRIEDAQMGWGSGGDVARVAMHLGKKAKAAVELACMFDPGNCGRGIDTLTLAPE